MFDPESGIQRKNVEGLIRAFCSAFRKDDDCYLVLKVNGRTQGSLEYEMVRAETTAIGVVPRDGSHAQPNYISWHHSTCTPRFTGPKLRTHMCQAMAMGVPVVASRYSGNLDFMRDDNSMLVGTNVIETERPYGPYLRARGGRARLRRGVVALRSLLDKAKRLAIGQRGKESVESLLSAETSYIANALISELTGIDAIREPNTLRDMSARIDHHAPESR